MLNRRSLLGVLAGAAVLLPGLNAAAFGGKSFDQAAFEAAQTAGKPILVDVSAPWCPTCRTQASILSQISAEPKFKDVVHFNVDFDSRKDVLRKFNVRWQSTLIVFKGKTEVGRSVGDTNAGSIKALVAKSI